MEHKIVLLNGAPGTGKDTLAAGLFNHYHKHMNPHLARVKVTKFALPLKNAVHALFGLDVQHDFFEGVKNEAREDLFGCVPRQEYIALSEDYVKQRFNSEFFGNVMVNQIYNLHDGLDIIPELSLTIISDSGFLDEAKPVMAEFGIENVMLIRLKRGGCDFSNDSRSLLPVIDNLHQVNLSNDGTVAQLINHGIHEVSQWLSKTSNSFMLKSSLEQKSSN